MSTPVFSPRSGKQMPSAVDTELARLRFEQRKLSRQLAALRAGETRRRTALLRVAAIALCHDGDSLEFIVQHLWRTAPHPFPLTDACLKEEMSEVCLNADTEVVADWLDWRDGVCTPGQLALARRLVEEHTTSKVECVAARRAGDSAFSETSVGTKMQVGTVTSNAALPL